MYALFYVSNLYIFALFYLSLCNIYLSIYYFLGAGYSKSCIIVKAAKDVDVAVCITIQICSQSSYILFKKFSTNLN